LEILGENHSPVLHVSGAKNYIPFPKKSGKHAHAVCTSLSEGGAFLVLKTPESILTNLNKCMKYFFYAMGKCMILITIVWVLGEIDIVLVY
jgi:hypothetical protein